MASGKGLLLGALGGLVLRAGTVRAVRDISPCFRAIELEGPDLRRMGFCPGDKLQMVLPSRDVRTFTPITWDHAAGTTELLVFHHDQPDRVNQQTPTPAGAWV